MASPKPEFKYVRQLVKAAVDGARSAPKRAGAPAVAQTTLTSLLAPTLLGMGIGALSASIGKRRASGRGVAAAGFLGGAVGMGAGAAWKSRRAAGAAARGAIRNVNAVRDAHWLEKNPIAYA